MQANSVCFPSWVAYCSACLSRACVRHSEPASPFPAQRLLQSRQSSHPPVYWALALPGSQRFVSMEPMWEMGFVGCLDCAAHGGILPRSARQRGRGPRGLPGTKACTVPESSSAAIAEPLGLGLCPPCADGSRCLGKSPLEHPGSRCQWQHATASPHTAWLPPGQLGNSLATAVFPSPGSSVTEWL